MGNPTRLALLFGVFLGCVTMLGCQGVARSFGEGVGNKIVHYLEGAVPPPGAQPTGEPEPLYAKVVGAGLMLVGLYFTVRRRVPAISDLFEGKKKPVTNGE